MLLNQWGKIPSAKPTILAFAVSQALFAAQANSATLTVSNASGDLVDGSLRKAIADAAAGDDIVFNSSLSGSTIELNDTDDLGILVIDKDLSINGDINGDMLPDITIDGGGLSRIMAIGPLGDDAPLDVQLTGLNLVNGEAGCGSAGALTIYNSSVSVSDSTISGNHGATAGGAIVASRANLSIVNTDITNNELSSAACSDEYYYSSRTAIGGAIATIFSSLDIQSSTITGNTAKATNSEDDPEYGYFYGLSVIGGGLGLLYSDLSLSDTDVSSNQAIIENTLTALPAYSYGSYSTGRGAGVALIGSLTTIGIAGDLPEDAPNGVLAPMAATPEGFESSGIAKLFGEEKARDLLDGLSSLHTKAGGSQERPGASLALADTPVSELMLEPTEIGLTISNSTITNNTLQSTSTQPYGEYLTSLQGAGVAYGLAYFLSPVRSAEAATEDALAVQQPLIISNTLIEGNSIVGATQFRRSSCDDSTYRPNLLIASGGGLFGKYSNAEITNSTISGNDIDLTGEYAIAVGGGWGYTGVSGGNSTASDSTFDSNAIVVDGTLAAAIGGGVGNLPFFFYSDSDRSLSITDSAITGNTLTIPADASLICGQYLAGGGLLSRGSTSNIDRSLIANNRLNTSLALGASTYTTVNYLRGAGISASAASMAITNSTVSGNELTDNTLPAGSNLIHGSGVSAAYMTSLDIVNSTIANNRTNSSGYTGLGLAVFETDTEYPHTVNVINSIIADNNALLTTRSATSATPSECYIEGVSTLGPIVLSNNWIGGDHCGLDTEGSGSYNPPGELLLGALIDNGGPTFTHAIADESAAFDSGDNASAAAFLYDQRGPGFDRTLNGVVDIGAYETVGDGDNSSTEDENAVPNLDPGQPGTGDGNGDGTKDSAQSNVASEPTTDGVTTATLAVDETWQLLDVRWNSPGGTEPDDFQFPYGAMNFKASGGSGDLAVSLYLPIESDVESLFKQNLDTLEWQDLASSELGGSITTDGTKIRIDFNIVDNGPFDLDDRVGFIEDPVVPAVYALPPASLAIAATNATQNEGNSGNTAFTFTVTRSNDVRSSSSATYTVTGSGADAADADDFGGTLPSDTVSFAAGETSQVITVNVSGDTVLENNEGFTVTLSSPVDATIDTAAASGTINNDDSPANLAIAATNAVQDEGDSGNTAFTFSVTRSNDISGISSATYTVAGSGADPADEDDFGGTLPSGTLSFAAGETSQEIAVNVSGDTLIESDEGFTVTLSAPSDATIGTDAASGTINNDDGGGFDSDPRKIPVMSTALQALTAMLVGFFGAMSVRRRSKKQT